jgi:hypothetical protein
MLYNIVEIVRDAVKGVNRLIIREAGRSEFELRSGAHYLIWACLLLEITPITQSFPIVYALSHPLSANT